MLTQGVTIFCKGFWIGFVIAAIIGPIAILCINRTLTMGRKAGLAVALGAALADATYGLITGFGVSFIAAFLHTHKTIVATVGGLFIIYLGIKTFLNRPNNETTIKTETGFIASATQIYFLTLANPGTILSFIAIFSTLGLKESINYAAACTLVSGVFAGSMLWFFILVEALTHFFRKVTTSTLILINQISGICLIGFGITIFSSLFFLKP